MVKLTGGRSRRCARVTSKAFGRSTSSRGSADGASRSVSQVGRTVSLFGQDHALAPLSPAPESDKAVRDAKAKCLSGLLVDQAFAYARYAGKRGLPMRATWHLNSGASFVIATPTARSLESRLRARMAAHGSLVYELRWKYWTMILGQRIYALRASEKTITGNGFSGWPTTRAADSDKNIRSLEGAEKETTRRKNGADLSSIAMMSSWPTPQVDSFRSRSGTRKGEMGLDKLARTLPIMSWPTPKAISGGANSKRKERGAGGPDLQEVAKLAGWTSPTAQDYSRGSLPPREKDTGHPLSQQAVMAGWATPIDRDWKDGSATLENTPINNILGRQVFLSRAPMESSAPSPQTKKASLNPAFSLWLMLGPFAIAWAYCGEQVTRLTHSSRRNSSKRPKKS